LLYVKRTVLIAILALGVLAVSSACTPTSESLEAIRSAFPASQYAKAVAVATCESGLNAKAVSPGGGNFGLFQINKVHAPQLTKLGYTWSQITNPVVNARLARVIYDTSGWRAWSCD
jgi:hypothetical protein